MLGYDFMDHGALAYSYDTECNAPAYIERTGLDLDETGAELRNYKLITGLVPQVTIYRNEPVQFQIGAAQFASGNVEYEPRKPFNPYTDYKVDARSSGRYLGLRMFADIPADWEVSGFDAILQPGGRR
ncbi:hypothetical protein GAY31_11460 [Azospirillum brasilense]|nr:hypothetical protein [Azospirillum brasilense]